MKKLLKITFTLIFTTIIVLGFAMPLNQVGNWYQQFLPNIGSRSVQDVFFLDSLTGWAITNGTNQNPDTNFVLKTTNSGDTWIINYRKIVTGGGFPGYNRIYFLNQNTGFVCSIRGFDKTTDGGLNWVTLYSSESFQDMSILNTDMIWLASGNSLTGGVFFTSNGGLNWQQQLNIGSNNPNHIYFYNGRLGFIAEDNFYLRRTTDGGVSWNVIPGTGGFTDMYFKDSLTGWKTSFQKTTNGGLNWVNQPLPTGGNVILSQIDRFSIVGTDTIWGVGGYVFLPGQGNRGMIYRSTNSGNTWQFQVPDTAISIGRYLFTKFTSRLNGWAYTSIPTGVHTTSGGDTQWLTDLVQINSNIPQEYKLFQNYPNPFNPTTNIKFDIPKRSNVLLRVFDVTGKLVTEIYNGLSDPGVYTANFDAINLASGIYYYEITANSPNGGVTFKDVKKMVVVK